MERELFASRGGGTCAHCLHGRLLLLHR